MPDDSFQNQVILVVDDEERMARFIRLNLEHDGFKVVEAYNGMKALHNLRDRMPDLVLLDVMLPDIDGFEVLKMIREISNVPVIMLTAKGEEDDRIQPQTAGPAECGGQGEELRRVQVHGLLRRRGRRPPPRSNRRPACPARADGPRWA